MTRLLLLLTLCGCAFAGTAHADTSWLCRPDLDDPCDSSLETTVVGEDGTSRVVDPGVAKDPGVDCFRAAVRKTRG